MIQVQYVLAVYGSRACELAVATHQVSDLSWWQCALHRAALQLALQTLQAKECTKTHSARTAPASML